ncbi:uncharacterized protein LOC120110509 [Phoenix dactylifera]|uniref:Uncharacterized protein LOC120110509 n=1 Tax=Phoenix dactylifera TaxID=42345 RepID=A0A8B9A794_PHODC|nr:uncharacterized protein LOC120110509 [Phoenix dactylifera]XP_038981572.1 uncharacterized protein LOC120110509 [Phoenix dactylifera]
MRQRRERGPLACTAARSRACSDCGRELAASAVEDQELMTEFQGTSKEGAMASQVLSEDENNVKALCRRGKARAQLGQTDAAREDFQKARKFAPEDKAIVREL